MRKLAFIAIATLALAACSSPAPVEKAPEPAKVEAPAKMSISKEDEDKAIAGLKVMEKDLDKLAEVYSNVDSARVKAAVVALREKEMLRLIAEADSDRDKYDIRKAKRPWDSDKVKAAVFQL